jgi:protein-disulfide isomerase-like protein with CxxC motif
MTGLAVSACFIAAFAEAAHDALQATDDCQCANDDPDNISFEHIKRIQEKDYADGDPEKAAHFVTETTALFGFTTLLFF